MIKDKLKQLRLYHGLSQAKIAEFLEISPAAYSTYETGTRDISSDKIIALAKFYGVTTDYLYGIEDKNESDLSMAEKNIIKKYRTLDAFGKKAVSDLLNNEYERCTYNENGE